MSEYDIEAEVKMDEAVAKGAELGATPMESALAVLLRAFYDQRRQHIPDYTNWKAHP